MVKAFLAYKIGASLILASLALHLLVYIYQILPFIFCRDFENCIFLNPEDPIVEIILFLISFGIAPVVFLAGIIAILYKIFKSRKGSQI